MEFYTMILIWCDLGAIGVLLEMHYLYRLKGKLEIIRDLLCAPVLVLFGPLILSGVILLRGEQMFNLRLRPSG